MPIFPKKFVLNKKVGVNQEFDLLRWMESMIGEIIKPVEPDVK